MNLPILLKFTARHYTIIERANREFDQSSNEDVEVRVPPKSGK